MSILEVVDESEHLVLMNIIRERFMSFPLKKYAEYLQVSCFIFSNDFFFQLDILKPVTWDFELWNEGCVLSYIIESLEKFFFLLI
jgi:hypothetical protein